MKNNYYNIDNLEEMIKIDKELTKIENKEKKIIALELFKFKFQNKIINEFIKLSNNVINHNEAKSIIFMIVDKENKFFYFREFFNTDKNTLVALEALNKFASKNRITGEDSINIFTKYIYNIAQILKISIPK